MAKMKKPLYLSGMLLLSQDLTSKRLGNWLTRHRSLAIKHLPDNVELIEQVFKNCVILVLMAKVSKSARNKIFSTLEFPLKNKWTTFLNKLNMSRDQNTLTTQLFKTLVQELTSKEKVYRPFWTPAYNELSETLWLPTETDSVGLLSTSSNSSSRKVVEHSQCLTTTEISLPKVSYQKTCYQLSTSSTVDKWANEVTKPDKLKTIKIKIYPTPIQQRKLDEIIDTHRFVYNRTLEYVKMMGHDPDFQTLRNLLATERTKASHPINKYYSIGINKLKTQFSKEKLPDKKAYLKTLIDEEERLLKEALKTVPFKRNQLINDFELQTSNEIRSNAIKSVCDAYKSGFSNLKAGNIKFFNMSFKKKTESRKCVELASSEISIKNGKINICPGKLKDDSLFEMSVKNKHKYKSLKIVNNCDLVKQKGMFYVLVTVPTLIRENDSFKIASGGDLGVRTFLTTYATNHKVHEYKHNSVIMKQLNDKLDMLKSFRKRPRLQTQRNKYRKKQLNKVEKKKIDTVNTLHWSVIKHLIETNDVIFMGDIKSHDIVKGNKNKTLNREFNDLKFYLFKQRLLYKASINNKKVFLINEAYTTQGCSKCGSLWKEIGDSKTFRCPECKYVCGRDVNSSKNMMMKGILTHL